MTEPSSTTRNLVLCLDGTNNEPEHGDTNVARIFDLAEKNAKQLVYYDPGVGTMGARGAVTRVGKELTRFAGLVAGHGIQDNIEEAYTWLSRNYQKGDRIYVFGFSRGAYTARALTGMLDTVGLLLPHIQADKLRPIAIAGNVRHPQLPNVPTVVEAGFPKLQSPFWLGVVAPAGTPQPIIDKLNTAFRESLKPADTRALLAKLGADIKIGTPQAFGDMLAKELALWTGVVRDAKITVE